MVDRHDEPTIVFFGLARLAPLSCASPVRYNTRSCRLGPVFWRVEPRAKMGGPTHWTPLVLRRLGFFNGVFFKARTRHLYLFLVSYVKDKKYYDNFYIKCNNYYKKGYSF